METQAPSVGRIVHYVSRGSADGIFPSVCRAAIITETGTALNNTGVASLCVLNPTGMFFDERVPYASSAWDWDVEKDVYPGGTWHWPERV